MPKLAIIAPTLLLAACAAHRSEIATVADTAVAPAEDADVKTVEVAELDTGMVCESRRRSGTRISRPVCYTREEQAALQASQREEALRYLDDLEREQRMNTIRQQEIEEQQRRALAR